MSVRLADTMVILTPDEWLYATMVGATRQIDNIRGKRQDRYGAREEDGWRLHIEGACGEMAVAKHFRLYWSGNLGNLKAPDVQGLQVRTRSRHDYDLIVHDEDPDYDNFVLVTGCAPRFVLRGWIPGGDAKDQRWWRDPVGGRPAFFVPQDALRDIATLPLNQ